mmetsp:Transcript_24718/g.42583  ORF Transcript_24718/g.42583 Transcript_24718/m.42583 type:complete len:213 (-) Transcript_24718:107-745(-)
MHFDRHVRVVGEELLGVVNLVLDRDAALVEKDHALLVWDVPGEQHRELSLAGLDVCTHKLVHARVELYPGNVGEEGLGLGAREADWGAFEAQVRADVVGRGHVRRVHSALDWAKVGAIGGAVPLNPALALVGAGACQHREANILVYAGDRQGTSCEVLHEDAQEACGRPGHHHRVSLVARCRLRGGDGGEGLWDGRGERVLLFEGLVDAADC